MNILVINAGSSSLKYQLMNPDTGDVTAKGLCERIGLDGRLTHKVPATGKKVEKDIPMPTHKEAIEAVMAILVDHEDGVIKSVDEIDAVGHRVLHGGDKFVASCLIDEACKQAIRDCIPLGPLHNPANLMGIEACEKAMPGKPQVAVFDTAFHMTMPPKAIATPSPPSGTLRNICAAMASAVPPTASSPSAASSSWALKRPAVSSSATSATALPCPQ